MSTIAAVAGVLPEHAYPQHEITTELVPLLLGGRERAGPEPAGTGPGGANPGGANPGGAGPGGARPGSPAAGPRGPAAGPPREREALLRRLHASAGVERRHLALPLQSYRDLGGFGAANDVFLEVGGELAVRAVPAALERAGLTGADVDLLVTVSVTGIAAPSLDSRLAGRLGLRPDVKRVPIFGLGCVAGAAGIARLHDYLVGHPDDVAVLLSVELCSLTFQRDDPSTANLVCSALFGDGAAAVVMVGSRRAARLGLPGRPQVLASRSRLYPDTERVMGWDVGGSGFRVVLASTVADVVHTYLRGDVDAFLAAHGLSLADIGSWVAHPGGPKVIEAMSSCLDLPPAALAVTRRLLAGEGNLSSSSVLHVLAETMAAHRPPEGSAGMLLAMGPGFCAELVLLQW